MLKCADESGAIIEVDTLEDIDDQDVSNYILQDDEAKQKLRWWRELHTYVHLSARVSLMGLFDREHLEKTALRRERPVDKEKKRRRSAKRSRPNAQEYSTAFEAVKGMLEERGLSSKINYDNLEALFAEESTEQDTQTDPLKAQAPQPKEKRESFFMRSLSFRRSSQKSRKRLDGLFD